MSTAMQAITDQIAQVRELFSGANQTIAALTERVAANESAVNGAVLTLGQGTARVTALENGAATAANVQNNTNWLSTLDGDMKYVQTRLSNLETSMQTGGGQWRKPREILIDRKGSVNVPKFAGEAKNYGAFKAKL